MDVNAKRKPSCHQSGSTSAYVRLSLHFSLLSPGSIMQRALEAVQVARFCTHWQRRYRSGASRRRCPAVGFLLRSLGCLSCQQSPGRVTCCLHREQRMTRAFLSGDAGTLWLPVYIVAAWLAAGGESGKRAMCRGEELIQN